jgi:putative transposase
VTDVVLEERRVAAVRLLIDMKEQTGSISPSFRRAVAASVGLSDRQLRRDIAAGARTRPQPERVQLSDAFRELLWDCKGNVSELWRRLDVAHGSDAPSRRTLARVVLREVSRATLANIKYGEAARHEYEVSLPQDCEDIGELFSMDAKRLSILARDDVEIWVINVADCCSRVIVNFVVFVGAPSAVHARRALRGAFLAEGPVKEFYGLPLGVRYDNALAHTATQITEDLVALTVAIDLIDAFHPWHNGIVEAFHRWVEYGFCAQQDFYSRGATALDGRLFVPDAPRPTFDQVAARYAAFVDHYNNERIHSELAGQTPAQVWRAHL